MSPKDRLLDSLYDNIDNHIESLKQLKNNLVYTRSRKVSEKINFRYLRYIKTTKIKSKTFKINNEED